MNTLKIIMLTIATTLIVTSFVLIPTWLGGLTAGFFVLALIVEVVEYLEEENNA